MAEPKKEHSSRAVNALRIEVDTTELDETIEKANQLVELLQEARRIIDSFINCDKAKEM